MSVSRSCERLSDLSLPPKMQRSLSQDLIRRAQLGSSQHFMPYPCFISSSCTFPGQVSDLKPQQESLQKKQKSEMVANTASDVVSVPISDPSMNSASIEVPTTTTCCLCGNINVDTQLRPCGHMFHGPCLKPSLQNAVGPPCCPIDNIPMLSAVLAIPTDNAICITIPDSSKSTPLSNINHASNNTQSLPLQPWGAGDIPRFHMPMAGPTNQSSTISSDT
mmetsp:Transcript_6138/g.13250  ORF Transcript_6138/g.13250 Transcript_6138/m.13250 type:complete len:220 (+) Transcript_6138:2170-2829(+)